MNKIVILKKVKTHVRIFVNFALRDLKQIACICAYFFMNLQKKEIVLRPTGAKIGFFLQLRIAIAVLCILTSDQASSFLQYLRYNEKFFPKGLRRSFCHKRC